MKSFDTNIVVHAANRDSPLHAQATAFIEATAKERNVVVCELMLVELFLKLCNARIFHRPMSPRQARDYCRALRQNRNWMLIESAPVMEKVWEWPERRGFAFRRLIDIRLGLTLRYHGVKEFATTNVIDFKDLDFTHVWNPLQKSSY